MAKIQVTVRSDVGDLGTHRTYGPLIPGTKLQIEEEHFGAELFERPDPDFLSPHELADKARAGELRRRVGNQEPPEEPAEEKPGGKKSNKGVTDHA